jgi:hypothetical protein
MSYLGSIHPHATQSISLSSIVAFILVFPFVYLGIIIAYYNYNKTSTSLARGFPPAHVQKNDSTPCNTETIQSSQAPCHGHALKRHTMQYATLMNRPNLIQRLTAQNALEDSRTNAFGNSFNFLLSCAARNPALVTAW